MREPQVQPDPLRPPVRDVLGRVGDTALPARPFRELVELPVRPAGFEAMPQRRWVITAVAAVATLVLGVVGLRAVAGRDTSATSGVAAMSERSVAVPLYVPEDMALQEAGVAATGGVLGVDGTAIDRAAAAWYRSDASLVVSSASGDQPLVVTGDVEVVLRTGAIARYTEFDDAMIDIAWRQPGGGPFVGIRSIGLEFDDVVDVAESMWYVTPAMWDDLTDHAGFASLSDARAGYDRWAPDTNVDLDGVPAVFVTGSLQEGFGLAFLEGNMGTSFDGRIPGALECQSIALRRDERARSWPAVLVALDPDAATFVLDEPDGTSRRIAVQRHPGLPQLGFAVSLRTSLPDGSRPVTCEGGVP